MHGTSRDIKKKILASLRCRDIIYFLNVSILKIKLQFNFLNNYNFFQSDKPDFVWYWESTARGGRKIRNKTICWITFNYVFTMLKSVTLLNREFHYFMEVWPNETCVKSCFYLISKNILHRVGSGVQKF